VQIEKNYHRPYANCEISREVDAIVTVDNFLFW
jgi:hypothetical protein